VYRGYRCTLHHSGATEGAFRVGVNGAMFAFKNNREIKINRTCLHKYLWCKFKNFLDELRAPDSNKLREMDAICGIKAN
jgi:hypothetical protein